MHQKVKKSNDVNTFKIGGRHRWKSELEYSAFGMHMHGIEKQDLAKHILICVWMVSIVDQILIKLP